MTREDHAHEEARRLSISPAALERIRERNEPIHRDGLVPRVAPVAR